MVDIVWLIPALPLLGFLLLAFGGKRIGEPLAGWLATLMVGSSFAVAVAVFAGLLDQPEHTYEKILFTWIPAGDLHVDVGFLVDPLSMAMILFITFVATLIHLYSIGYMHGDSRFSTFFTYLNLFVLSMLVLVLGNNMLLTFVGWEGVGACSYFLISFWFTKEANASAGKKAFVTNRIGDWGFMVAMFMTFFTFGTLNYTEVMGQASGLARTTATFIALMLFVGAVGKSAQIPLYIWLPDAMAGPTPVSALIHAATMVTAGVYLMTRANPIIAASDGYVGWIIAGVGAATAFVAATIAMAQHDIKKVLAYSTVSQLGYMFLAVGSGAYVAAIFHMITHAFFKACLFLGSGSVIHGMADEQDMRFMGALRRYMPITAGTFIVAWLAIAGVFPLSGFWSKDEIIEFAWAKSPVLGVIGFLTALLTAYYMSRLVFLTFYGEPRWGEHAKREELPGAQTADELAETAVLVNGLPLTEEREKVVDPHFHPHESAWTMTLPLVVLAVLSVIGGVVNLPGSHLLADWLHPVVAGGETHFEPSATYVFIFGVISTVLAFGGIGVAYLVWLKGSGQRQRAFEPTFLENAWYYDLGITAFMGGPGRKIFDAISWFDRTVIDGVVNGVGAATRGAGQVLRRLQNGYVRSYALGVVVGAVLLMAFVLTRVLKLS
jgi:NADH-quinone oxidoreductase subunit L